MFDPNQEECDFKVKPPQMKKQADQLTEEWVHRYLSLKSSSISAFSINKQNDDDGLKQQRFFIEGQSDHTSSGFNNVDNGPDVQTQKLKTYGHPAKPPKISVIIISYNFEGYLRECIESILNQTLRPFEIIICDDCSTDNSWTIISEYARQYPELIKSYRHERNIGMQRNGSFSLKKAEGDLISGIDGDDRWLPRKLELEWKALQKHPDARVAYSNVYTTDANGNRTGIWYDGKGPAPPSGDVFVKVFSKRFFPNIRSVFRNELVYRSALEAVGYQDGNVELYIDWDFKIRLTARFPLAYSGEALVEYRVHGHGIHNSSRELHYRDILAIYKKNLPLLASRTEQEAIQIKKGVESLLNSIMPGKPLLLELSSIKPHSKETLKRNGSAIATHSGKNKTGSKLGEQLIFLISQPRAGSTLLQRILAGHPEVHTMAEPWIMLHPIYALKRNGIAAEYESSLARQGLDDFLMQVPEGEELYIKALREMASVLYNRMVELSGKSFFLDKTPRYYFIIPELYRVFPKAKFIFLLRNPMAVLSSVLSTWCGNQVQALVKSPNYIDLTKGPHCLIEGVKKLKGDAIVVHYENLVKKPKEAIQHVCNRIGIPFYENMLEYGQHPAPKGKFGDSVGVHKHNRPVSDYVDKWVENLRAPGLMEFAHQYLSTLGSNLLSHMGYSYQEIKNKLETERVLGDQETAQKKIKESSILNQQGEDLFSKGDIDGALNAFAKAIEIAPNFATAYNNLGVLYWQTGEVQKAVDHFAKALEIDPDDRDTILNCGAVLTGCERTEDARKLYSSYLQTHPDDEEVSELLKALDKDRRTHDESRPCMDNDAPDAACRNLRQAQQTFPVSRKKDTLSDPANWPLISIVTPSFNQGQFLEECIDSILSQNYPNLEYIIMDGGSTDNSVDIIKKYERYLTYWQSKPDGGQYAAINEGFKRTTGEIMTWLNSDDKFHPNAFRVVASIFMHRKDVEWIMGRPNTFNEQGQQTWIEKFLPLWSREKYLKKEYKFIQQEGTFWRRSLWVKSGATLNTDWDLAGDLELWVRFFRYAQLYSVDILTAGYRYHSGQKAQLFRDKYIREAEKILDREILLFKEGTNKELLPAPKPILISEIREFVSKSDFEGVLDAFAKAIKITPNSAEVILNLVET